MRALILAGLALAAAACNKDQSPEQGPADANVAAGDFTGNDVTAIDAATNDDANMAADAEVTLDEANLATDSNASDEGNAAENSL